MKNKLFQILKNNSKDKVFKSEITDLTIEEISLTASPAVPAAKVIIGKSSEISKNEMVITKNLEIVHKNLKEGFIFQYGLVPDEEDLQGDTISNSQIEQTTKRLQKRIFNGKLVIKVEHEKEDSTLVDYLYALYDPTGGVAKALGFPEKKIRKGGMVIGIQLTEKGIDSFNKGTFKGISIGGKAQEKKQGIDTSKLKSIIEAKWNDIKNINDENITNLVINTEKSDTSLNTFITRILMKVKTLAEMEMRSVDEGMRDDFVIRTTIDMINRVMGERFSEFLENPEKFMSNDMKKSMSNTEKEIGMDKIDQVLDLLKSIGDSQSKLDERITNLEKSDKESIDNTEKVEVVENTTKEEVTESNKEKSIDPSDKVLSELSKMSETINKKFSDFEERINKNDSTLERILEVKGLSKSEEKKDQHNKEEENSVTKNISLFDDDEALAKAI